MLIRLPVSLLIASLATFVLYFGMNFLILSGGKESKEATAFKIVDTRVPPKQSELELKDRKPPKPKEPEQPPELPKFDQISNTKQGVAPTTIGVEFTGPETSGGISIDMASDRDILPIVRVEPQYPDRAAQRGIEGYVIMQFTVLASGAVDETSIQVIEAQPEGTFDRAATRAVSKWKYKPKVEDGKPVPQYGVQTKLTFQLEK